MMCHAVHGMHAMLSLSKGTRFDRLCAHLVPWKGNLLTLRAAQARTSRRSPQSGYDPVSLPRQPCDART
jgi:hypothetical protein